jgi:hypothetical protein
MRVLYFISLCIVLLSVVHGSTHITDDEAKHFIADQISEIGMVFKKVSPISKSLTESLIKSLSKSIDQKCMLEKYQKYKLADDYLPFSLETLSDPSQKIDSLFIFMNIGISCSSKHDGIMGFLFNNIFTFSGLIEAFRDDEPVKGFLDNMGCYTSYAVESKILDPAVFTHLNTNLVNITKEECDGKIAQLRIVFKTMIKKASEGDNLEAKKCLETRQLEGLESFFFRYLVLVPEGLTADQKKVEKVHFIKDNRDHVEKLILCNVKNDDDHVGGNEI